MLDSFLFVSDSCLLVLDSCSFVLSCVGLMLTCARLVLIRVASCRTRADLRWHSCIRIDLISHFAVQWKQKFCWIDQARFLFPFGAIR